MNKAILIGRLTTDPNLKMTPSGVSVLKFTIAINRVFKKEGEDPEADFIICSAWNKLAENMATYLKKGSKIAVEGRIQTGSYIKDGVKIYTTEVIASSVEFLESKKQQVQPKFETTFDNNFSNFENTFNVPDDDLPF